MRVQQAVSPKSWSLLTCVLVMALGLAESHAQTRIHRFDGTEQLGAMGLSVSGGGDVDGDFVPDVVSGMPLADRTNPDAGAVRVYSGRTGRLLYEIAAAEPEADFGRGVALVGDLTADGRADLVIGAPGVGSDDAGASWLYSGRTGSYVRTVGVGQSGDFFGNTVAGLGDVDGDGLSDLMVGAWSRYAHQDGYVTVRSGADSSLIYRVDGEFSSAFYSPAISGAGDLNDDGVEDFITSSPGSDPGYVFAFSGATGEELWRMRGFDDDNFGQAVASFTDYNGDGKDDVLVGAPQFSTGDPRFLDGAVFVLSGENGAVLDWHQGTRDSMLGRSVVTLGDVDGDGRVDFAAGAPQLTNDPGQVIAFSGHDLSILFVATAGERDDSFGFSISRAGDVNGDGVPDLVTGAPGAHPGDMVRAGSVYVVSGQELTLQSSDGEITPSGGRVRLELDFGPGYAGRPYVMYGSLSGVSPGIDLGEVTLPLNYDPFMGLTVRLANTDAFRDFRGTLDGQGRGVATFDTLGPFDDGFVGVTVHFAALVAAPVDTVSNALRVTIVD